MSILPFQNDKEVQNSVSDAISEAQQEVEGLDEDKAAWNPQEDEEAEEASNEESTIAEVKKLEAQIESLKEQQGALKDKNERISEKIGALRENLKETQEDAEEAFSTSEKAAELVEEVEPQEINKKLSQMEAQHKDLHNRLNQAEEKREDLRNRLRETRSKLDEIGSIETVKQLKDDADEMLKTSQKLSEEAEANANRVEEIFHELQEKSSKIQEIDEEQEEIRSRLNDTSQRVDSLEVKYEGLPSQDQFQDIKDDYQDTVNELEQVIPAVEQAFKDIENIEESKLITEEELQEMRRKMENSTVSTGRFKELRNTVETLQGNVDKLTASLKDVNEKKLDELDVGERLSLLDENIAQLEERVERVETEEKVDKSELENRIQEMGEKIESNGVGREEFEDLKESVDEATDLLLEVVRKVD